MTQQQPQSQPSPSLLWDLSVIVHLHLYLSRFIEFISCKMLQAFTGNLCDSHLLWKYLSQLKVIPNLRHWWVESLPWICQAATTTHFCGVLASQSCSCCKSVVMDCNGDERTTKKRTTKKFRTTTAPQIYCKIWHHVFKDPSASSTPARIFTCICRIIIGII